MRTKQFDENHPGIKLLVARLVWDLVPHSEAPKVLRQLGLNPPSEEGAATECRNSHIRMGLIDPLENDIEFMAGKIAEIAIRVILEDAAETIGSEIVSNLVHQYDAVIGAALKVALANFMATGMLVYQKRK